MAQISQRRAARAALRDECRPTATPQQFAAIGVLVMAGRVFTELDNEESMKVASSIARW